MSRILWRIVRTRGHRLAIDWIWDYRDCWVGVYWRHDVSAAARHCLHVYVCLLPMVPLRLCLVLWRARESWPGSSDAAEDNG